MSTSVCFEPRWSQRADVVRRERVRTTAESIRHVDQRRQRQEGGCARRWPRRAEQLDDGRCGRRYGRRPRVSFEKLDGTQAASVNIADRQGPLGGALQTADQGAAGRCSAAGGDGLRLLALQGAVLVEGGLPLLMDGKIVGSDRPVRRHESTGWTVR